MPLTIDLAKVEESVEINECIYINSILVLSCMS